MCLFIVCLPQCFFLPFFFRGGPILVSHLSPLILITVRVCEIVGYDDMGALHVSAVVGGLGCMPWTSFMYRSD